MKTKRMGRISAAVLSFSLLLSGSAFAEEQSTPNTPVISEKKLPLNVYFSEITPSQFETIHALTTFWNKAGVYMSKNTNGNQGVVCGEFTADSTDAVFLLHTLNGGTTYNVSLKYDNGTLVSGHSTLQVGSGGVFTNLTIGTKYKFAVSSNDVSSTGGNATFTVKSVNTLDKGYQLVNGDVYDKHGNLLIDMENGFTPDGYTLSPDFSVVYGDYTTEGTVSLRAIDIFNGTISVPQNTDGTQSVKLGSDFSFTSSEPDFYVEYASGTVAGVNFGLNNMTTGQAVKWFSNVQADKFNTFTGAYNSSRPGDKFNVKASGQGGSGNVSVTVKILQ
ncbi:hypothetical protein WMW72_28690 [Paenibacillus filicis]|uniref:Uncharacterized protein n=1 Tax=Paenibacillus filicis TaxID=669464 RepID=A0ABU9DVU8_9BACL